MLGTIYIANDKGRDAEVNFYSRPLLKAVKRVDASGEEVRSQKYIKYPIELGYEKLLENNENDTEVLAEKLIKGDPELDMEVCGKFVEHTNKIYINQDGQVVFSIEKKEHIYDPQGNLLEIRNPKYRPANINKEDAPLKWSGKLMPKSLAIRKFVFIRKYQLMHGSGLEYDFLFDMAKKLHDKNAMMLINSQDKGGQIILREGGNPYRAFLEGRVDGDRYTLLVHITNLQLKALPKE